MRTTIDLNSLYEDFFHHEDDFIKPKTLSERVEALRTIIFDFDYPVDEEYRKDLELSFLYDNWFKEINAGTYTRWHFNLQGMLQKNGSRINAMYKSQLGDIETAINMVNMESVGDVVASAETDVKGKGNTIGKNESFSESRGMDTPQGRISMPDNYVSNLSDNKNVATSQGDSVEESSQKNKTLSKQTSTQKGYSGMPLFQLKKLYSESVVIANEYALYVLRVLFLETII